MQESPCLNPDCFGEIRLLSKKCFNMIAYDAFEYLATDWKKRDWTIVFDVLSITFFKNWYNVYFLPLI